VASLNQGLRMTNWVKCKTTVGDKILINFDYVAAIQQDARKRQTTISFANGKLAVLIKETPEQLIEGASRHFRKQNPPYLLERAEQAMLIGRVECRSFATVLLFHGWNYLLS
jgi:hypothetical protein